MAFVVPMNGSGGSSLLLEGFTPSYSSTMASTTINTTTDELLLHNGTVKGDGELCLPGASTGDTFTFVVYGVLLNTVCCLGLVGNAISVFILTRPAMRSSINCCFVGLSTFDSIVLLTSILMFGLSSVSEYTGRMRWYITDLYPWITLAAYPLGVVAQTGSVYLTVTVTVERYVAVCHPLRARSLCTYGRAKSYVLSVALFSLLYNIPRFAEITYEFCEADDVIVPVIVMTAMRSSTVYIQVYITWLYLIVMYLFPFLSLLVFNVFIYKQVRLANTERQHLSRRQQKELGLAVLLLVVVVVFFFCNILAFIISLLELCDIVIENLTTLSNFLVSVNSSVNFIIYCIFGQKFRKMFFQIFCFGAFRHVWRYQNTMTEADFANNSTYSNPMSSLRQNTHTFRVSSASSLESRKNNSIQMRRQAAENMKDEAFKKKLISLPTIPSSSRLAEENSTDHEKLVANNL